MEYLHLNVVLPYLKDHFQLHGIIKALVLHTASMGESQIDDIIGDLEEASNPTVGLLAHPGQVDIRVTAKAVSEDEADRMIQEMVTIIRQRLGDVIYGQDNDTLEKMAVNALAKDDWSLGVVEAGLDGMLIERLKSVLPNQIIAQTIKDPLSAEELKIYMASQPLYQPGILIGASLVPGQEKQNLYLVVINPDGIQELQRSYGGPPGSAPSWAVNLCLDLIRKSNL
jgi:nicotinamide-nucleotide amidase